ncbi:MAG: M48 family metallopeptidase [Clostridia bacterium]|nr:M48 family metallopeptidase [Oscillospiraceae bacterium]MBQ3763320.1 M48 family metallopeptidase [Clostridia bacterium]
MKYEIIRSNRKTLAAQIRDGKLIVRAPFRATAEEIERFVRKHRQWIETHLAKAQEAEKAAQNTHKLTDEEVKALVDRALKVIPERVAHYAPLVGVTYGRITIRNQRTRWGSCSSKGNLNFNCLLMLAPPQVLDSVVVHELCHRKEMNHSAHFYAEVLRVFPDYWEQYEWLKQNGSRLLALLP